MACQIGRPVINIEDDLLENGENYDFFQAVRLLSRLKSEDTSSGARLSALDKLRIRPELSLDHPISDVAKIRQTEDGRHEILTTFLGLYGVSSPLPSYYTEQLLNSEDDFDALTGSAARGFMDIVHFHLYPLFYQLWLKYRFSHNAFELKDGRYWDILFSLVGLSDEDFRDSIGERDQILRYVGLFSQRQKSATGLKTLVKGYLQTDDVEIIPCVEREVSIPEFQYTKLGESCGVLGQSATIGRFIKDSTGKFVIKVGSDSIQHFTEFVHEEGIATRLKNLVNFYLAQPLEVEIILVLKGDYDIHASIGGEVGSSLGQDTWLGGAQTETAVSVTLA